ncbi:hypothetical protein INT45_004748 [Circinella minor]|uniref:Uncharacterized protein n=1 Tax=Circinella minor TaxID=1195481 RepID=A0A8H7VM33_9FUNG|nr:hypothetical protein INT45_004748 [Circinella minor]
MLAVIALCFHAYAYKDMRRKKKIRQQQERRQRQQIERWQDIVNSQVIYRYDTDTAVMNRPRTEDEENALPPCYTENSTDDPEQSTSVLSPPPPTYKNHHLDTRIR